MTENETVESTFWNCSAISSLDDAGQRPPSLMSTTLALLSTIFLMAAPAAGFAFFSAAAQTEDCREWQECRDQAQAAAADRDFERFHDLAWRAVQKGPKNDPGLLTMLARAQSLSGRPHDALVMLQRLAAMGVATDAGESDDFRRVRALPAWKEWQARESAAGTVDPATGTRALPGKPPTSEKPATDPAKPPESKAREPGDPAAGRAADDAGNAADAVRFTTIPFTPAGLAYDAVSKRFILGDRLGQKLTVIGERSQRPVNLTGSESGGFGYVEAITIDVHEGDLWVASTPEGEPAPGKLHKLQLISGRLLTTATLPEEAEGARLTDIEVTSRGDVLALDSAGRRLFRLSSGGKEMSLMATLKLSDPASIAPAPANVVYVAGSEGLSQVVGSKARPVKTAGKIDLTGLAWIRWLRGRLIGVQRSEDGLHRIVRIRLDTSGRTATRLDVLEKPVAMATPLSVAITEEALYYLARDTRYSGTDGMDLIIRRVRLRNSP